MKKNSFRPPITTREQPPKLRQSKDGVQVLCPFCNPPHPLIPGQESTCGTTLKVTALQTIIPQRTARDKGLKCLKCGETGRGEMVRFGNGFIHLVDCKPETRLIASPPPNNRLAERVFKLKDGRVKAWLEGRFGRAQVVEDITTGQVHSYFFLKVKAQNGKHPATDPG